MALCRKCGIEIEDGKEMCEKCSLESNQAGESYLDQLLD
jgi:NMD protein affecting ribosome stability and mRNA decay